MLLNLGLAIFEGGVGVGSHYFQGVATFRFYKQSHFFKVTFGGPTFRGSLLSEFYGTIRH